MRDTVYLIMTEEKIDRMRKTKPSLRRNEHAIQATVEVDDSFFRSAIPEMTVRVGPEDIISPEVGLVVEEQGKDGEPERTVKDPADFVDELYQDVLNRDEVRGLPKWAHDAVVTRLRDQPWFDEDKLSCGLTQGDGPEEAVYHVDYE